MASTWRFCVASISGVLPSCQPHRKRSVGICMYTWYRPIIHFTVIPVYTFKTIISVLPLCAFITIKWNSFFFLKSITNNVRKLRIISNKSVYKHIVTISLVLNRRKPATSVAYTRLTAGFQIHVCLIFW